ncbi:MAG: SDR family NAD(P)-dependent oxidoreductase, partial [Mycobacteriales bacterium]
MTAPAGWRGRTVVVTGGASGVGLEAARALHADGADVVLACRDVERARAAAGGMTVRALDLADLDSVAAFADGTERVDALVCNAGIMGGPLLGTAQGHERQMGTNHLGHAALVARLFPLLEQASGRVVVVSSIAARGGTLGPQMTADDLVSPYGYLPGAVYANTKQANLLFAQELHR